MSGINLLLIIAIAQGLLLTLLLFHKHSALYPNRFLGLLMLIFSLSLLHVYMSERRFYDEAIIGSILPVVIFLLGPLHYLYTKYLIHPPRKFIKAEWLHFVPAAFFVIFSVSVNIGLLPQFYENTFLVLLTDKGCVFQP